MTLSIFSSNSNAVHSLDQEVDFWKLRKEAAIFLNFLIARSKCAREELGVQRFQDLFGPFIRSMGTVQDWSGSLKTHVGYKYGNDVGLIVFVAICFRFSINY